MAIKKNYLIEKRNILNEIRSNNMTLQELRFFCIYLAKINARNVLTRVVRFPMSDFQKIMELSAINMTQLQYTADTLLGKVVGVTLEDGGGYKRFQLFKEATFFQDEHNDWCIEIDAHDQALPLMFEFKEKYFTYELWNALRLKSSNQLRMYEILKQYEKIGYRVFSIDDLKELLGLKKSDYPRYNSFKSDVLEVCRNALEKYTDIKFTYEPTGKIGRGKKVYSLKFIISRNDNYVKPLSISEFIDIEEFSKADDIKVEAEFHNDRLVFLSDACKNEFSEAEIQVLYNLIIQIIPHSVGDGSQDYQLKIYNHLKHLYDILNLQAERREIKNRFGYFKKMLEGGIIKE